MMSSSLYAMLILSKTTLPQNPFRSDCITLYQVPRFWKVMCYNIGGNIYSLDDMEHGVLRANSGKLG